MSVVNALILSGYGLNCDYETIYAFQLAGARASRVHINSLVESSVRLADFHIMAFIGGFSWGDDHGAGVIQAVRMKTRIGDQLLNFIEKGGLIIGICNGFQCLVNLGLLPGIDSDYTKRCVALTHNDCGNFRDDWVNLAVEKDTPCIFSRGLDFLELPVRHGEGKFIAAEQTWQTLRKKHQIVLRYAFSDGRLAQGSFPHNPNGSMDDIAGICDSTGRIFGLMPHPEAYNHWTNHPQWPLLKEKMKRGMAAECHAMSAGVRMLKNGVDFFK